jgi:hypothetical protein
VRTLTRKWKRAIELFSSSAEALEKITATADPSQVAEWKEEAQAAQRKRHNDEFRDLIDQAGYQEGLAVVIKF